MIGQWMEQIGGFAANWLGLVLLAAWRALPILFIVAGVILVCRRRLSPSLHALLLTLVVARLLLPVSLDSRLSLQNPLAHWLPIASEETSQLFKPTSASQLAPQLLPPVEWAAVPTRLNLSERAAESSSFPWGEALWTAVLSALVAVSIGLILRNVLSHLRFAWKLRSCRLLEEQKLVDLLLRECDSLAVGRRPAVREVPTLSAPAVFGMFRQTICLPPNLAATLSEQELRWVIRHELAHIRRRDIPVMLLASVASAFHWFNPVVWLVVNRLRAAMEAASDQLALKALEPSDVAGYGKLLLRLAQNDSTAPKSPVLGMISFTSSGQQLKQRIELLLRRRNSTGAVGRALVACLVAGLAAAGLTDEERTKKLPVLNLLEADQTAAPLRPTSLPLPQAIEIEESAFAREYDLESILETMPEALKGSNTSPLEQLTSWLHLPPEFDGRLIVDGKSLSANLTVRQHELLKQTLELWKDGKPKQILIQTKVFHTDVKTASSIDWAGSKIDGVTVRGLGPAIAARIRKPELDQFHQVVSSDHKATVSQVPTVMVFDGQTAGIFSGSERPFVTAVDPKADGSVQPVISLVEEGLRFRLTPNTTEDGCISLEFAVTSANIGEVSYANLPIKTSNAEEAGFTVQVPTTEQSEVNATVKIGEGESVIVAIPQVFKAEPGAEAERTMVVVLTPRIIAEGEIPAQAGQKQ